MLLCDFHIHTTWSDGSVDLPEVVDIYGQAGFDVISITDHVYNSDSTIGSWAHRLDKAIAEENFPRYMETLEREANGRGAYGMLVIPGVEITKNYLSEEELRTRAAPGPEAYVSADLGWEDIFREARGQARSWSHATPTRRTTRSTTRSTSGTTGRRSPRISTCGRSRTGRPLLRGQPEQLPDPRQRRLPQGAPPVFLEDAPSVREEPGVH